MDAWIGTRTRRGRGGRWSRGGHGFGRRRGRGRSCLVVWECVHGECDQAGSQNESPPRHHTMVHLPARAGGGAAAAGSAFFSEAGEAAGGATLLRVKSLKAATSSLESTST